MVIPDVYLSKCSMRRHFKLSKLYNGILNKKNVSYEKLFISMHKVNFRNIGHRNHSNFLSNLCDNISPESYFTNYEFRQTILTIFKKYNKGKMISQLHEFQDKFFSNVSKNLRDISFQSHSK